VVADVLQLAGLIVGCFALGMVYPPLGVLAFGAALFFVGMQIERSK
jgi:hypothetical protein